MKSKIGYKANIIDHDYVIQGGFYRFLQWFGHKIKIVNLEGCHSKR